MKVILNLKERDMFLYLLYFYYIKKFEGTIQKGIYKRNFQILMFLNYFSKKKILRGLKISRYKNMAAPNKDFSFIY